MFLFLEFSNFCNSLRAFLALIASDNIFNDYFLFFCSACFFLYSFIYSACCLLYSSVPFVVFNLSLCLCSLSAFILLYSITPNTSFFLACDLLHIQGSYICLLLASYILITYYINNLFILYIYFYFLFKHIMI
jgi:hypothetical protein